MILATANDDHIQGVIDNEYRHAQPHDKWNNMQIHEMSSVSIRLVCVSLLQNTHQLPYDVISIYNDQRTINRFRTHSTLSARDRVWNQRRFIRQIWSGCHWRQHAISDILPFEMIIIGTIQTRHHDMWIRSNHGSSVNRFDGPKEMSNAHTQHSADSSIRPRNLTKRHVEIFVVSCILCNWTTSATTTMATTMRILYNMQTICSTAWIKVNGWTMIYNSSKETTTPVCWLSRFVAQYITIIYHYVST